MIVQQLKKLLNLALLFVVVCASAKGHNSFAKNKPNQAVSVSSTVDSPVIHCISVDANGNITITWSTPSDPSGLFNSYNIYSSLNASGPFNEIDSITTYSQTGYTTTGINGNIQPAYFYVLTNYNGGSGAVDAVAQDTIESIFLTVVNPGNGLADLSWNSIRNPNLPSSTGWYDIYREYPAGVWTLIDSTTNLAYHDTISICSATLNYRIQIGDAAGCESVSSVDGGVFHDITVPKIPAIDSVSVNAAGNATIGWQASTSNDTQGYILYQFVNGSWAPIDTIWGQNNTSFTNPNSNASMMSEQYRVAAFDSCNNTSPMGVTQNSIFLSDQPDVCGRSDLLQWNEFTNMPAGLKGYNIYVSVNGGTYTLAGTNNPGDTLFQKSNMTAHATYSFVIQAYSMTDTITASSNIVNYYVRTPREPAYSYLNVATVTSQNHILISSLEDTSASISRYKFLRANGIGNYSLIGQVPATPGNPMVTFTDMTANPNSQSYAYKVVAVDSCGYDTAETNIGQTMFLTAVANEDFTNTLTWNSYTKWLGAVSRYNIYRAIDGVFDSVPIATIPNSATGSNEFNDDISNVSQGEGRFSYYIQAVEGSGNQYGLKDTSYSNIADAYQEPELYVPNAFDPTKGDNRIFRPVGVFEDSLDYKMMIFDRWGRKMFESDHFYEGWDGKEHGRYAPVGAYVYWIRYKSSRGQYFDKKGTVTLFR